MNNVWFKVFNTHFLQYCFHHSRVPRARTNSRVRHFGFRMTFDVLLLEFNYNSLRPQCTTWDSTTNMVTSEGRLSWSRFPRAIAPRDNHGRREGSYCVVNTLHSPTAFKIHGIDHYWRPNKLTCWTQNSDIEVHVPKDPASLWVLQQGLRKRKARCVSGPSRWA